MIEAPIIAIVDDDVSICRSLQRLVESAGYTARTFTSARAFLDWLPQGQAACLVLDVQLDGQPDGMSGLDLQRRLAVPVIFITAHDDALTVERIRSSSASGHLRKPIDGQAVLDAIRNAVDGVDHGTGGTPPPGVDA